MRVEIRKITDRNEWLAWRRHDLTASDLAAAAGFDDRRSPLSVYAEKTGLVAPTADTLLMRRGRWLEIAVLAALREQRPDWEIKRAGVYLRDADSRLGATPDAVAIVPGITGIAAIQLKVVSRPVFERDWTEEGAPLNYQVQTIVEAMLMEASHAYLAALVIDTFSADLVVVDVPRHAKAEERAVEVARDFWRRVDACDPPPMNYDQDAELVRRLYPASSPGKTVDLTGDNMIRELLERRETTIGLRNAAADELASIDTEIKSKLGDADRAIVPGWRLTWKSQSRKGYSVAPSEFRVLRVTQEEG